MHCELCGRTVDVLHVARIEGAVLRVCRECVSLGEKIRTERVSTSDPVSEEEIVVPRLERELGVELTERVDISPVRCEEPLTLGDVIRIRRK